MAFFVFWGGLKNILHFFCPTLARYGVRVVLLSNHSPNKPGGVQKCETQKIMENIFETIAKAVLTGSARCFGAISGYRTEAAQVFADRLHARLEVEEAYNPGYDDDDRLTSLTYEVKEYFDGDESAAQEFWNEKF